VTVSPDPVQAVPVRADLAAAAAGNAPPDPASGSADHAHADARPPAGDPPPAGTSPADTLAAAVAYAGRGWAVIPVPHRSKYPELKGWEQARKAEADLPRHFGPAVSRRNLGLLLGEPAAAFPPVDPGVAIDDADAAVQEMREVVCDFRFETPDHEAAWLAGLLTPLARFAFDGPAPLFLIDANVRGAGKGLLAQTVGEVVLGREMPVSSYAHDPDEMRKKVTAIAIAGDRVVHPDNLEGNFGNDVLDRALTTTRWKDRVLGKSQEVDLPLLPVWFGTGNNVAVAADTARRVVHVRLDVLAERPEERCGFRHPDLARWVRRERPRLLARALTVLVAYCNAGRPAQGLTPFGSFEGWSALVREAVVWAGLPDPCRTRTRLAELADTTADALGQLVSAWRAYDRGEAGVVVSDALSTLYRREFPPSDEASGGRGRRWRTWSGARRGRRRPRGRWGRSCGTSGGG
jgi:hypothetical protein